MPKFFTVGKKKKETQTTTTPPPGTVSYGDAEEIQGYFSFRFPSWLLNKQIMIMMWNAKTKFKLKLLFISTPSYLYS